MLPWSPGWEIQDQGLDTTTDSSLLSHFTGQKTEAKSKSNFRTQLMAELGFELMTSAVQAHRSPLSGLPCELADLGNGSAGSQHELWSFCGWRPGLHEEAGGQASEAGQEVQLHSSHPSKATADLAASERG